MPDFHAPVYDSATPGLALHHFTRGREQREYWTAHVYDVRNGKLTECWEQPRDPEVFETAWR